MTESTKTLNSTASTLKKNPGRVGRLVKAAKLLIVPPKQYATGKTKELLDAAVKKLKAKRGLNGVVGEGAGPFSDKALQKVAERSTGDKIAIGAAGGAVAAHAIAGPRVSSKVDRTVDRMMKRKNKKDMATILQGKKPKSTVIDMANRAERRLGKVVRKHLGRTTLKGGLAGAAAGAAYALGHKKEAMEQKNKDRALAATAVASGAALGGVLNHDSAKARTNQRLAIKGNARYTRTGESIETRLARSAKTQRRMVKPLRRAGIKGAIVGGLAGAALGAAHLKKEAGEDMKDLIKEAGSILASRTVQQRAQQAFKHFKDKDVRVAALKRAAKTGALAGGIAGAGAVVTKKNDQLKKQAAELVIKDGKKYRKGTVSSAANTMAAVNGALRAVGKGGVKGVAKAALNGGMLGGAYGTVRGANRLRKGEVSLSADEMKKVRGLKKKAAELIHHKGEDIRRGTVGSAAGKMALGGAALGGLAGLAAGPVGGIAGAAYGATQGAIAGGLYGIVRGALRAQDGEKSMTPHKFDQLKAKIA